MTEDCHASNAKDLRSAIIAACAMLLTFAAVAVPVPLYAEYKIALGLTDAGISLTMVSYLTGVLIVLMMLNAILLPLAQETVTQRITIRKAIKPLVVSRRTFVRYSRLLQDAISRLGAPACSSNRCQPLPLWRTSNRPTR